MNWNGKDTPIAHTCGHNIHMAAWIGTAQASVALKGRWGTVMFVGHGARGKASAPPGT